MSTTLKESLIYDIVPLVLVGGKGTRLVEVTGGIVSKGLVPINPEGTLSGLQYIIGILRDLKLNNTHLSTRHFSEQYKDLADALDCNVLHQEGETGTGGAIEEAMRFLGSGSQYLVISVDTLFSKKDLLLMLNQHRYGTVTWGVGTSNIEEMSSYFGLVVDDTSKAIIGDTKLPWWKGGAKLDGKSLYVKGAIHLLDPRVYLRATEIFRRLYKGPMSLDFYWDILPMMEEQNRRRVERGKGSFLQAVIFEDPIIDFGTPERLNLARDLFYKFYQSNEN